MSNPNGYAETPSYDKPRSPWGEVGPILPAGVEFSVHTPLSDEQNARAYVVAELSRRQDPERTLPYVLEWAEFIVTGRRRVEGEEPEAPTLDELETDVRFVRNLLVGRTFEMVGDPAARDVAEQIVSQLRGVAG